MRQTLFFLLLFPFFSYAQISSSSVKGSVSDDSQNAVPFASIAAYSSSDSSLVKGVASDVDGNFSIELAKGNYYLQISYLSYKTKIIPNIKIDNKEVNLGDIRLESDAKLLDEVEVVAERNQMELKMDKRVFNVDKDLTNVGANAAEILDNIPSVTVDIEGNIALRGSENVRVLIDGKPSAITGGSTADVLRQFQGNMIEKVEIITNPSSRYDAEGEVGIINIILKKEKQKGINGSVEAVVGYPDNYRLAYNLNYRKKKFNLFTSFGIGYRDSPGFGNSKQSFNGADTSYVFESETDRSRSSFSQNIRLGSDWFINNKNTITVSGFFNNSVEENITNLVYKDFDSNGELFQEVQRDDIEDELGQRWETAINYKRTFDKKDEVWTVDLQYSKSDDLEDSDIDQTNSFTGDLTNQQAVNTEVNGTFLAQTDYILPIGKEGRLEMGYRMTLRQIENDFSVTEAINGGEPTINPDFNNDFLFTEDVYAGYLQFGNKIENFSYQFGLRTERSIVSTELKLTDETNNWDYTNLFPSAFLGYELSKQTTIQLSYSRRINRPSYRYLLPFQTFSDIRNLWGGNPNLQPEFTDSYEMNYLKYFEKGSVFSSIYYRHRTGVIQRITVTDDEGFARRIPVNLSTENNIGYELTANYKFKPKTSVNATFNFYRSETRGSYEGINLDNEQFAWTSRGVFKTALLYNIDAQLSLNYNSPQNTAQGTTKSITSLDISLAKDVLKGKGTLVASVRDVFNSRVRRWTVDDGPLTSESEFQWRARQFLLSFTYRINEKKSRNERRSGDFDAED